MGGADFKEVKIMKEITVSDPKKCPAKPEHFYCRLARGKGKAQIMCPGPKGSFPLACPLNKDEYLIKKESAGENEKTQDAGPGDQKSGDGRV